MSNEDRIKGWRSRRKASNYTVGSGVANWRLDPAALFEAKAPPAVLFKPLLARRPARAQPLCPRSHSTRGAFASSRKEKPEVRSQKPEARSWSWLMLIHINRL